MYILDLAGARIVGRLIVELGCESSSQCIVVGGMGSVDSLEGRHMNDAPLLAVLSADAEIQAALGQLAAAEGWGWQSIPAADMPWLSEDRVDRPLCVVLDLRQGMDDAFRLWARLGNNGFCCDAVAIARRGDVAGAVRALKAGIAELVEEPVEIERLSALLRAVMQKCEEKSQQRRRHGSVAARLRTLSARERTVLDMVTQGKLNKQIAAELGIVPKTVEAHRSSIMAKMQARSLAELIQMMAVTRPDAPNSESGN